MRSKVPNLFPTVASPTYRLGIIGEAPGADEEHAGKPFVGMSGKTLDQLLSKNNVLRAACFIGNICQIRPDKNDISKFDLHGPEIQEGLAQLRLDLAKFKPNLVLLLGKTALWAAKGTKNLGDWRGSVFMSETLVNDPFNDQPVKCLATYHPAAALRMYEFMPLLNFDLRRAVKESHYPEMRLPQRELVVEQAFHELLARMDAVLEQKPRIAVDIEGGIDTMSCISIATNSVDCFIVPFTKVDESSYWSLEEEVEVWRRLALILTDPQIEKVLQNSLYDRFVLQFSYNIVLRGLKDDTMIKWWSLYCELEKALSVQASLLTDESYYKFERKTEDQQTFYTYCCKDSAVTFEINEKLEPLLGSAQLEHYRFNVELLNPLLYMELRGIRYDVENAKRRLDEINQNIWGYQEQLDNLARGLGVLESLNYAEPLLSQIQKHCCYVRDQSQPKADAIEAGYWNVVDLITTTPVDQLTEADRGRISTLCGITMNTKSHKKFQSFLYTTCKLPTQWKKDQKTKEMRVTTDYEALLKLTKSHDHPALRASLELSRLRTRSQMLAIRCSSDGRMRCAYNLVGSETGRVTSSKSVLWNEGKRVGTNMQTVSDDWDLEDENHPLAEGLRNLYLADEGCYLAKCDLKGADGWTVGAYMAMLGDRTMLDDLLFGIKPAQIVAYILKFGATEITKNSNDRVALKELCSKIKKEDWEYFVSKQGIWGTCYTMGPRKLAERVFIESDGKVNLSESQAKDFQASIYIRYRVKTWHTWMQRHLDAQVYPAKLVAPNGFARKFFGRKTEILGEALAHMPQVITTYATLKAAHRLWNDSENRTVESATSTERSLRVEPMHTVHDELLVQFKIEDTTWAISKLKQWFDNPIVVAGQKITIPFDGAYGTAWSMGENEKVGDIK